MERRKVQRQAIETEIVVPSAGVIAKTRNISTNGGVCFVSPVSFDVGSPIEYMVTLSGGDRPVRIVCDGQVVRCVEQPGDAWEVAATMIRYHFAPAENAA